MTVYVEPGKFWQMPFTLVGEKHLFAMGGKP